MDIKKVTFIIASSLVLCFMASAQSKLISINEKGKLSYHSYTDKGDLLPDFSFCGYKGGGVAIPHIKVTASISPSPNKEDDTPFIQAVIDKVAKLQPDEDGFRGCILLRKGVYHIASPIRITASGIVLRGEGNNKESGTVLIATSPRKYNVIEVGFNGKAKYITHDVQEIIDKYVPSGTRILHVKNADKHFRTGDDVIVRRPSTAAWIQTIGMDSIAPRPRKGETTWEAFERFRREGKDTDMNGTIQWKPGSKDLTFERKIVSVKKDEITLDIPLTNALQKEFGGGTIYKYRYDKRFTQCGVENLYGMCIYDESVKKSYRGIGEYCCDENHANTFVALRTVENAWVRNVSVEHFDCCVTTTSATKYITGQDLSAINPISQITGGRRYAYHINGGQMCLFQRCYSSHHRHEFVLGATTPGPNAFVDGYGEMTFASSEPHHRWSAGCLWDNIVLKGPSASLMAANRGSMGSGHGWAGAQMVFWNCAAPLILVMQPPTAQNFAIGLQATEVDNSKEARSGAKSTFNSIVNTSMIDMKYKDQPINGTGWTEQTAGTVVPSSLYYYQLRDRLGKSALKKVMDEPQYNKYFNR